MHACGLSGHGRKEACQSHWRLACSLRFDLWQCNCQAATLETVRPRQHPAWPPAARLAGAGPVAGIGGVAGFGGGDNTRVRALAQQRGERAEGVGGGQARGRRQDGRLVARRRQQADQRALEVAEGLARVRRQDALAQRLRGASPPRPRRSFADSQGLSQHLGDGVFLPSLVPLEGCRGGGAGCGRAARLSRDSTAIPCSQGPRGGALLHRALEAVSRTPHAVTGPAAARAPAAARGQPSRRSPSPAALPARPARPPLRPPLRQPAPTPSPDQAPGSHTLPAASGPFPSRRPRLRRPAARAPAPAAASAVRAARPAAKRPRGRAARAAAPRTPEAGRTRAPARPRAPRRASAAGTARPPRAAPPATRPRPRSGRRGFFSVIDKVTTGKMCE